VGSRERLSLRQWPQSSKSGERFDQDSFDAALDEPEQARSPERNVDLTSPSEGSPIGNRHEHGPTVA
jgi:hypothetical protein